MKGKKVIRLALIKLMLILNVSGALALNIDMVTVGNPGNEGELSGYGSGPNGSGPEKIVGGVGYIYQIGKCEITAGQYTEFLNSVAATDTYELYNTKMWSEDYGCKIQRLGSASNYTYSVASDWQNRPVNYVSWSDAVRFTNWLSNGQPSGMQDMTTTEDGSYYLDGATSDSALMLVSRNPNATWVIPSEDEWYKAAYHKNDGTTGNYWDYPTGTNEYPSNDLIDTDPGNNATYWEPNDYTIGPPYYRTEVGAHKNSASPYGTFDQGGNVYEWNETDITPGLLGLRGGAFSDIPGFMAAGNRGYSLPWVEGKCIGFRIALVPEPSALILLGLGGIGFMLFACRQCLQTSIVHKRQKSVANCD